MLRKIPLWSSGCRSAVSTGVASGRLLRSRRRSRRQRQHQHRRQQRDHGDRRAAGGALAMSAAGAAPHRSLSSAPSALDDASDRARCDGTDQVHGCSPCRVSRGTSPVVLPSAWTEIRPATAPRPGSLTLWSRRRRGAAATPRCLGLPNFTTPCHFDEVLLNRIRRGLSRSPQPRRLRCNFAGEAPMGPCLASVARDPVAPPDSTIAPHPHPRQPTDAPPGCQTGYTPPHRRPGSLPSGQRPPLLLLPNRCRRRRNQTGPTRRRSGSHHRATITACWAANALRGSPPRRDRHSELAAGPETRTERGGGVSLLRWRGDVAAAGARAISRKEGAMSISCGCDEFRWRRLVTRRHLLKGGAGLAALGLHLPAALRCPGAGGNQGQPPRDAV